MNRVATGLHLIPLREVGNPRRHPPEEGGNAHESEADLPYPRATLMLFSHEEPLSPLHIDSRVDDGQVDRVLPNEVPHHDVLTIRDGAPSIFIISRCTTLSNVKLRL